MSSGRIKGIYPEPRHAAFRRGRFAPPKGPLTMQLAAGAPRWVKASAAIVVKEVGRIVGRKIAVRSSRGPAQYTATMVAGSPSKPKTLRADRSSPPGTREQAYDIEICHDKITIRGSGWAGLGHAMMSLLDCCDLGLRCGRVSDAPRFGIRAMLLHLSYNQWRERPSTDVVYGYSDKLRFDKPVFDEAVTLMARLRMNMIVLDMGDAVRYRSHPEIAVRGALRPNQLRRLLDECRGLGLEPIPKLNFATTHDAWLKEYGKMVGTEQYYQVCDDLIGELTDLFDGPRFFHVGMDEETIDHCQGLQLDHIVLRTGQAWLDAVKRLDAMVRDHGARTWMWGDPLWPDRDGPRPEIPRRILLSDWNYSKQDKFPTSVLIEKLGYDNVSAGANWSRDENIALWARFAAKKLDPKKNPGLMMTVWNPTVRGCRCNVLNAISLAAGAFWNPQGPSRSPWPRDHYVGTWKRKKL